MSLALQFPVRDGGRNSCVSVLGRKETRLTAASNVVEQHFSRPGCRDPHRAEGNPAPDAGESVNWRIRIGPMGARVPRMVSWRPLAFGRRRARFHLPRLMRCPANAAARADAFSIRSCPSHTLSSPPACSPWARYSTRHRARPSPPTLSAPSTPASSRPPRSPSRRIAGSSPSCALFRRTRASSRAGSLPVTDRAQTSRSIAGIAVNRFKAPTV